MFKCVACGTAKSEPVYESCQDYYMGKPFRADYVRCSDCKLVQQSPIPTDVSAFYDAYPVHMKKSLLHRIMRKLVMAPVYFDASATPKSALLLDFGCGDGWFLADQKALGKNVIGFERDREHAKRLSEQTGVRVFSDLDELYREYEGKVDVLTMHFVLEHLPNLKEAFQIVKRLLRPGGLYFYVVPHFDSVESRLFGKKWHNLDAPRHLSFPDESTARSLAGKTGFKFLRKKTLPFPNGFAGSLPVVLAGRFSFILFLLSLPFGILFSRIFPNGVYGYWLVKE